MSGNAKGELLIEADGKEYRLHLGMSVLADLQGKHGQDVLTKLDKPADAGDDWMPPLVIIVDLMIGALGRYHEDEADKYLVDDILAEKPDAALQLIGAAFPDQAEATPGKAKRSKRAA